MRNRTALPRKTTIAAALAAAALVMTGCAQSNDAPAVENSPSFSPTATSFTKTVGEYSLSMTRGAPLPADWPNIPAPNGATLIATGTATAPEVPEGEELVAAAYQMAGNQADVEADQIKQMHAAGWHGGVMESGGILEFEHGHEYAYIRVDGYDNNTMVNVFQIATVGKEEKPSPSASPTRVEPRR